MPGALSDTPRHSGLLVDTAGREGVDRLVWWAASLRLLPVPAAVFYKHLKEQVGFFWSSRKSREDIVGK